MPAGVRGNVSTTPGGARGLANERTYLRQVREPGTVG